MKRNWIRNLSVLFLETSAKSFSEIEAVLSVSIAGTLSGCAGTGSTGTEAAQTAEDGKDDSGAADAQEWEKSITTSYEFLEPLNKEEGDAQQTLRLQAVLCRIS